MYVVVYLVGFPSKRKKEAGNLQKLKKDNKKA